MHSLLEVKRMGGHWDKIIFSTDDLACDHLEVDDLGHLLRGICQEMSTYLPDEIFMPHEVADVVVGSLDQDDYNSNYWEELKACVYDLVIDFTNIVFQAIKGYAVLRVLTIDETNIQIQIQQTPKELY